MKERLIELLMQGETEADKQGFCNCYVSRDKAEYIADFLLANGVIVTPCNIGDTVFLNIDGHTEDYLDKCYIKSIERDKGDSDWLYTAICEEKADYCKFWASEVGTEVLTSEDYWSKPYVNPLGKKKKSKVKKDSCRKE